MSTDVKVIESLSIKLSSKIANFTEVHVKELLQQPIKPHTVTLGTGDATRSKHIDLMIALDAAVAANPDYPQLSAEDQQAFLDQTLERLQKDSGFSPGSPSQDPNEAAL